MEANNNEKIGAQLGSGEFGEGVELLTLLLQLLL